ncbi:MAG TPA: MOSC domain-containing protein [Blastocatellia bacterium]|nr:MOSC domain-containing protein [Blastocatellia bacterium]
MKVISVNVGLPREVEWKGRTVTTGIFKEPAAGRVRLRRLNLDGDGQADLAVHGGRDKAVYAYPVEHYDYWRRQLPEMDLPFGMFGENLTIEGLFEDEANIGDRFLIGSALVMVTQPRMPCYKLGLKFGRDDIIKQFLESGRSGFYLAVIEEGEIAAGDRIELIARDENNVKVSDIVRLYARDKYDVESLRRATRVEALPKDWRDYFAQRLEKII